MYRLPLCSSGPSILITLLSSNGLPITTARWIEGNIKQKGSRVGFYLSTCGRCVPDAVVVRVKARAFENKRWQRLDPAGGRWGLFGLHTVPENATAVVVTEVRGCRGHIHSSS